MSVPVAPTCMVTISRLFAVETDNPNQKNMGGETETDSWGDAILNYSSITCSFLFLPSLVIIPTNPTLGYSIKKKEDIS